MKSVRDKIDEQVNKFLTEEKKEREKTLKEQEQALEKALEEMSITRTAEGKICVSFKLPFVKACILPEIMKRMEGIGIDFSETAGNTIFTEQI